MTTSLETTLPARSAPRATPRVRSVPLSHRLLVTLLERLQGGALEFKTPDGTARTLGRRSRDTPPATLELRDWNVANDIMRRGDIGFGEAYIDGRWQTHDLVALLGLLAFNRTTLERSFHGRGIARCLLRLRHWLNSNTRQQAPRNIAAHYDIGNAFYALWLDATMTYSAGWFGGDVSRSLEDAQAAKYRRVLESLALTPGAHILEIGCGWGGFAEFAAREGFRVTGLSLSQAQIGFARDRIERAGLGDRVTLRVQDYRDEGGRYDGVASIEMIEAVGERWWPVYFDKLSHLLPPGARACLQAITIDESLFDSYRIGTDFIQHAIFPGGMLPAPSRIIERAGEARLALFDSAQFGADYAETLRRWLVAFDAHENEVRALGFDDRFVRCWRFYLAYCIAGFTSGSTDVGHYTFVRR